MKKLLVLLLVISLIGTTLAACSSGGSEQGATPAGNEQGAASGGSGKVFVSLATGSVSGVYYPLGGAFASIINNNIEGANCSVESTGGSVANILLIAGKEAEMGFVAASDAYAATHKQGSFADKDIKNVKGVLSLYPEAVQIVSINPDIKSVADLKGKKVAVGAVGSGTEVMAKRILGIYGMSYDDIQEDFLGFSDASTGLKDKTTDAAFIWAGVPTSGIMDLGSQHKISLVNFEASEIDKLKEISPYCVPISIDKSVYSSLISDITTIAIPAVIVAEAGLPEDFVYNFLAETFENIDVLKNAHARGNDITLKNALNGLDQVPLHPGAEKFYKEKGILK